MKENVIDLYIQSKVSYDYMTPDDIKCYNSTMATRGGVGITTGTNITPREEDQEFMRILLDFAKKHGLKLKVHDLADKKEKRKALFKRIRPPVFIFKGRTFKELPSEREFLALL